MQVILTQDVENLGGANDVVEVKDGYARNFLMPRGLAMPATKSAMANLDNMRAQFEAKQTKLRGAAEELAARISGKTLTIPARVGEGGKLYGSIGTHDIAERLQSQFGIELDRRQVLLEDTIREAGTFTVPVKLHRDVQAEVSVQVGDQQ